ncbi:hypothetical protein T02_15180, partial [Trichinella nativa]
LDIKGFLYYKSSNVIGINNFCPGGVLSSEQVSFLSLTSPLKSHHCTTSLQYLGKYVFVRRETSSGKFYCKLSRKQPIWNSLETALGWLNFDIGNVFCIIVRSELKLRNLVQYFFVLRKSIFLHFPSIWNKLIEIVSARFEMLIKSSNLNIIFNQLNYVNKNLDIKGFLYYKSVIQAQMLLSSATFAPGRAGFVSISDVPTKIVLLYNVFAISRQIHVEFKQCRPRGYFVNQCLEQQSRSALCSFSQYRLQLGVVKFYNFLYCEIWEAVENLYEDIILLPRIRILNYDSNEICTIRKQNKMLPTDVVDTSKYSDYPAKLLVHYEMESKH